MSSAFRFQDIFVRGVQDPYPFYHWLRTEAPVYWNAEIVPAWFISRYDDVAAIIEDDRRFGSRGGIESAVQQERDGCFWHTQAAGALFTDGLAHSRARGLLDQSWPSEQIAQMRGRILQLANTLLDRVWGAGTMDIVAEFAEPLSYTVFKEFLGADDLDLLTLKRWAISIHAVYDPLGGPEEAASGQQVCREVSTYFRDLIGQRRKSPTTDFVSGLLAAERGGTRFSDEELLGNLLQIIPGPDPVTMLISNAMLALIRHGDQLALLKNEPALVGGAVEECLRYDSLILGFPRVATEDVNVRGQLIRKGEQVFPLLRSANRDPARFPEPDRLDITRPDIGQLSFGHGVHYCLGAPLARLLAQIGISTLVERLSGSNSPRIRWNIASISTSAPCWLCRSVSSLVRNRSREIALRTFRTATIDHMRRDVTPIRLATRALHTDGSGCRELALLDADLQLVAAAWGGLPVAIRTAILTLAELQQNG